MDSIKKRSFVDIASGPGWRNFAFMFMMWLLAIFLYTLLAISVRVHYNWLAFYVKYTWPNFLLVYFHSIWLLPVVLRKRTFAAHLSAVLIALGGYIVVRYFNNSFWDESYYVGYLLGNVKYNKGILEIIQNEWTRGFEFIALSYAYRLVLERIKEERNRKELEAAVIRSELASLRSQVNPHFLFNAINSIYYMALKKSDSTPTALLKLADIFRYVLQEKNEMVTLEKEMDHVKHLISFEKIRFPDSVINFNVEIAPSQKWLQVPPLVLTAFVENAFKHGDPGTKDDPISINLKVTDTKLQYSVVNPLGTSHAEPETESGIGLENLIKRVSIVYGNRGAIKTEMQDQHFLADLEIDLSI